MYISDLEIFGFKSFAHKSLFKFSKGITCVVGPNGCGKTNVVDGIRWVLGEQRSSLLRSDKMTDVIFAGSKYKKAVNYAEVSLTIHNDRGILPVAYTDLTVARRLFRDGTSEYLLNNTPVRLKDIHDLFADTGMSSDVYSVIELKMVEDILNENKDSRRRLFEEASGISKYRSQRKSSVRKLDATREDLTRLEDIIYEIDKKVGALRRQLKRYEKYQEYIDELRDMEILYGQCRYQVLSDEMLPLENQLTRGQVQKDESFRQLSIEEGMLQNYKENQGGFEKEIETLNSDLSLLNTKLGEIKSFKLVREEKINYSGQIISRLQEESGEAAKRREANERIRDEISGSLTDNDPRIFELKEKLKLVESDFNKAEETFRETHRNGEILEEKLMQDQRRIQEINQKKIRHEDSINHLSVSREELDDKINLDKENYKDSEEKIKEISMLVTQLSKERSSMLEVAVTGENEKNELNESLLEEKETFSDLRHRLDQLKREQQFFNGILESMEGFNPGVKYVLKELKHPGILGSVADLISVNPDYRTAIEIGLGNAARFLVADKKESALDVIDELKSRRKGRVTIVPLDIAAEKIRRRQDFHYESDSNFIAYAGDVVKAEAGAELLVAYFLNDLILVKNLRDLPESVMRRSPFRFVTPDGDYYEQKGLIRGGKNRDNSRHILGRREKIEELKIQIDELRAKEEKYKKTIHEKSFRYSEISQELKEIKSNLNNLEDQFHAADKQMSTLEYGRGKQVEQGQIDEKKAASYSSQIMDTGKALNEVRKELEEAEKNAAVSREVWGQFQIENETVLAKREELNRQMQEVRIDLISREREKENIQFRYNNAVETIVDLVRRIENMSKEIEENNSNIIIWQKELAEAISEIESFEKNILKEEEKRSIIQKNLNHKRQQISDTTDHINDQHRARENVFQTLKDIELKLIDIGQQQRQIKERIYERYHVDLSLRDYVESEMSIDEIEEHVDKFRRKIELIGPINMAVKVEYDEESARLKFLQEQQTDLLDAEKSVLETLEKLDSEARTQFVDIFNKVRANFNKTFTLFFPNGEGDIKLSGATDPLDATIEIMARPKTKELKTLKALSGGEKALTAISLLFSIYLVKPSPYCILDEVDAPLDDQNIKRFTSALSHFTDKTQFIIVTHNKLTMEAADYLYGVTMEEEGVSKIVSVKFK